MRLSSKHVLWLVIGLGIGLIFLCIYLFQIAFRFVPAAASSGVPDYVKTVTGKVTRSGQPIEQDPLLYFAVTDYRREMQSQSGLPDPSPGILETSAVLRLGDSTGKGPKLVPIHWRTDGTFQYTFSMFDNVGDTTTRGTDYSIAVYRNQLGSNNAASVAKLSCDTGKDGLIALKTIPGLVADQSVQSISLDLDLPAACTTPSPTPAVVESPSPSSSPSPSPTPSPSPEPSPSPAPTKPSPSPVALAAQVELDENGKAVVLCFDKIVKSRGQRNRRPTQSEIEKAFQCFEEKDYILPVTLAPISPDKVQTIKSDSKSVAIQSSSVAESDNQAGKVTLKGNALPKSTVYLYVHSAKARTYIQKADSQGNWQYTIKDDLEGGSHNAYAVVRKSSGEYVRSEPIDFAIAKAAAATTPPSVSPTPALTTPQSSPNPSTAVAARTLALSWIKDPFFYLSLIFFAGLVATLWLHHIHISNKDN